MARSEKSENKNRVLGLDIGNGYGYVSLLETRRTIRFRCFQLPFPHRECQQQPM